MLRFAWETGLEMLCELRREMQFLLRCELPRQSQIARQIRRLLAQATSDCR